MCKINEESTVTVNKVIERSVKILPNLIMQNVMKTMIFRFVYLKTGFMYKKDFTSKKHKE